MNAVGSNVVGFVFLYTFLCIGYSCVHTGAVRMFSPQHAAQPKPMGQRRSCCWTNLHLTRETVSILSSIMWSKQIIALLIWHSKVSMKLIIVDVPRSCCTRQRNSSSSYRCLKTSCSQNRLLADSLFTFFGFHKTSVASNISSGCQTYLIVSHVVAYLAYI